MFKRARMKTVFRDVGEAIRMPQKRLGASGGDKTTPEPRKQNNFVPTTPKTPKLQKPTNNKSKSVSVGPPRAEGKRRPIMPVDGQRKKGPHKSSSPQSKREQQAPISIQSKRTRRSSAGCKPTFCGWIRDTEESVPSCSEPSVKILFHDIHFFYKSTTSSNPLLQPIKGKGFMASHSQRLSRRPPAQGTAENSVLCSSDKVPPKSIRATRDIFIRQPSAMGEADCLAQRLAMKQEAAARHSRRHGAGDMSVRHPPSNSESNRPEDYDELQSSPEFSNFTTDSTLDNKVGVPTIKPRQKGKFRRSSGKLDSRVISQIRRSAIEEIKSGTELSIDGNIMSPGMIPGRKYRTRQKIQWNTMEYNPRLKGESGLSFKTIFTNNELTKAWESGARAAVRTLFNMKSFNLDSSPTIERKRIVYKGKFTRQIRLQNGASSPYKRASSGCTSSNSTFQKPGQPISTCKCNSSPHCSDRSKRQWTRVRKGPQRKIFHTPNEPLSTTKQKKISTCPSSSKAKEIQRKRRKVSYPHLVNPAQTQRRTKSPINRRRTVPVRQRNVLESVDEIATPRGQDVRGRLRGGQAFLVHRKPAQRNTSDQTVDRILLISDRKRRSCGSRNEKYETLISSRMRAGQDLRASRMVAGYEIPNSIQLSRERSHSWSAVQKIIKKPRVQYRLPRRLSEFHNYPKQLLLEEGLPSWKQQCQQPFSDSLKDCKQKHIDKIKSNFSMTLLLQDVLQVSPIHCTAEKVDTLERTDTSVLCRSHSSNEENRNVLDNKRRVPSTVLLHKPLLQASYNDSEEDFLPSEREPSIYRIGHTIQQISNLELDNDLSLSRKSENMQYLLRSSPRMGTVENKKEENERLHYPATRTKIFDSQIHSLQTPMVAEPLLYPTSDHIPTKSNRQNSPRISPVPSMFQQVPTSTSRLWNWKTDFSNETHTPEHCLKSALHAAICEFPEMPLRNPQQSTAKATTQEDFNIPKDVSQHGNNNQQNSSKVWNEFNWRQYTGKCSYMNSLHESCHAGNFPSTPLYENGASSHRTILSNEIFPIKFENTNDLTKNSYKGTGHGNFEHTNLAQNIVTGDLPVGITFPVLHKSNESGNEIINPNLRPQQKTSTYGNILLSANAPSRGNFPTYANLASNVQPKTTLHMFPEQNVGLPENVPVHKENENVQNSWYPESASILSQTQHDIIQKDLPEKEENVRIEHNPHTLNSVRNNISYRGNHVQQSGIPMDLPPSVRLLIHQPASGSVDHSSLVAQRSHCMEHFNDLFELSTVPPSPLECHYQSTNHLPTRLLTFPSISKKSEDSWVWPQKSPSQEEEADVVRTNPEPPAALEENREIASREAPKLEEVGTQSEGKRVEESRSIGLMEQADLGSYLKVEKAETEDDSNDEEDEVSEDSGTMTDVSSLLISQKSQAQNEDSTDQEVLGELGDEQEEVLISEQEHSDSPEISLPVKDSESETISLSTRDSQESFFKSLVVPGLTYRVTSLIVTSTLSLALLIQLLFAYDVNYDDSVRIFLSKAQKCFLALGLGGSLLTFTSVTGDSATGSQGEAFIDSSGYSWMTALRDFGMFAIAVTIQLWLVTAYLEKAILRYMSRSVVKGAQQAVLGFIVIVFLQLLTSPVQDCGITTVSTSTPPTSREVWHPQETKKKLIPEIEFNVLESFEAGQDGSNAVVNKELEDILMEEVSPEHHPDEFVVPKTAEGEEQVSSEPAASKEQNTNISELQELEEESREIIEESASQSDQVVREILHDLENKLNVPELELRDVKATVNQEISSEQTGQDVFTTN
ncbi:unnamed protein product [Cyprideis torosa]|uniref:Uncharacterized protein n=1 Tax=Cyprideis torosa TaxID=163714 RepID=A0A7R8ZH45_9CRUS|nr:unnamed protein product [Cyprideis torosa]CAG0881730.1 unnamed protein product [Cyprideis torosa]